MKQFGEFCLDGANQCLWRKGARVLLPPKPFAVLRYLVENPGRLVTHDELLDALWPETYVQPQVLRTYMLDLRKALGDDAREPRFIESMHKRGYRFVAPVHEAAPASAPSQSSGEEHFGELPGREEELASLAAHLRLACSGSRQVVFVTGEAGVGKSSLLEAFCAICRRDWNAAVGVGQCLQAFTVRHHCYAVTEAIESICRENAEIKALMEQRIPAWLKDKTLAAVPAPADLCAALESAAQDRLILLVLEDLQRGDEATLDLISALAHRRTPAKLLILASTTPPANSAALGLRHCMHDLLIHRMATELSVSRLCKQAIAKLLRARLRVDELPAGLLDLVHVRSEGNPLFAGTLLEHLIAEQILCCPCGGRWELRADPEQIEARVPDELAQMIELELEQLTPEERRLLEAGSLISVAFPAWAVAAALDQDTALTEEACDELARRFAFVKRAGEDELPDGTRSTFYVFAHGLYRDALYQRQSPARRAQRHVRIADRLRTYFPGREELVASQAAIHYEAGCEWQRALDTLHAAQRSAAQKHALALAEELREQSAQIAARMHSRQLTVKGAETPSSANPAEIIPSDALEIWTIS